MLNTQDAAITASTRVGIIGGGQLGLMTAEAARAMQYANVTVLDPTVQSPASIVAEQIVGSLKDPQALRQLAARSDLLTYEIEHINIDALRTLQAEGARIHPSPDLLAIIQNKLEQKEFLARHDIPVAPFLAVDTPSDIEQAAQMWGYPLMLKARRDAYDGRGNACIDGPEDVAQAVETLKGRVLYVEKCLELDKELGLMIARNEQGEIMTHPVVQMIHARNICQVVLAPAPVELSLQEEAREIARRTISFLEGVGIFGFEFFLDTSGKVWLNEIAPRPHNLGHYTIEACKTSQFTQHLRAISNLPLTSTEMLYPAAVMINILGDRDGPADPYWIDDYDPDLVFVHIYGKRETRFDRKMGHITVVGDDLTQVYEHAQEVRAALSI